MDLILLCLDLEFKIIYVGSAETIEFDQTLDQIVVDAVPKGQFKFMFQVIFLAKKIKIIQIVNFEQHLKADPPDIAKIPADDAVGVTVVLITASYREQEFVRVGYYVNNEYEDQELKDEPPLEPQFNKLVRTIATDQPRVTKFKINWDSANSNTATNTATNGEPAVSYFNGQDSEMVDDNTSSNKNEMVSQQNVQTVEI